MAIPVDTPVIIPDVVCQGCGGKMRSFVIRGVKGKIVDLEYHCDVCKYGHRASLAYCTGTPTKYRENEPEKAHVPKAYEHKPRLQAIQPNAEGNQVRAVGADADRDSPPVSSTITIE